MSLIGIPQFAYAGYNINTDYDSVKTHWNQLRYSLNPHNHAESEGDEAMFAVKFKALEDFLNNQISKNTQDTYTVHAIVSLSSSISEYISIELILSRIFDELLPKLEQQIDVVKFESLQANDNDLPAENMSMSVITALIEIILLLIGILPNLTSDSVNMYYLQHSRSNLPQLLGILLFYDIVK